MVKVSNNLAQGSKAWLEFRGTGLGASDASIVMGQSPWKTRFELWAEKTKMLQPAEPHVMAAVAMKRGTDLEPEARRLYNAANPGYLSKPINVEHPIHSFLRASLDGLSSGGKVVLEIKTPGKKDLEEAAKGKIPNKYFWQLVQQMMLVPDATHLDYVTFDGKKQIWITRFDRDEKAEKVLLKDMLMFWGLVQTKTPPLISHDDLHTAIKRLAKEQEKVIASMKAVTLLSELLKEAK
jgi:putative phage-type endonuclease